MPLTVDNTLEYRRLAAHLVDKIYGRDHPDREDYVQEGVLAALEHSDGWPGGSSRIGWISRIIIARVWRYDKTLHPNAERERLSDAHINLDGESVWCANGDEIAANPITRSHGDQVTEALFTREIADNLIGWLHELGRTEPALARTAWLFVVERMSHEQISRLTNTTVVNSRQRLKKARQILRIYAHRDGFQV